MGPDQLKGLLEQVAAGALTADQAWQRCDPAAMRALPGVTLDLGRPVRCGFGEVVYGEGKSAELIGRIAETLLTEQDEVLITRCAATTAETLRGRFATIATRQPPAPCDWPPVRSSLRNRSRPPPRQQPPPLARSWPARSPWSPPAAPTRTSPAKLPKPWPGWEWRSRRLKIWVWRVPNGC